MRDVVAAFFGALVGGAFSSTAALLYIAAVRRVGRKVFGLRRLFLWLPIHFLFAFTLTAPMFFPFFALGLVRASFPLTNALHVIVMIFGILGLVPPFIYFFVQWNRLQRAGYLPPLPHSDTTSACLPRHPGVAYLFPVRRLQYRA